MVELEPVTMEFADPERKFFYNEDECVGRVLPALRRATVLRDLSNL
jgi:hypothetical protein